MSASLPAWASACSLKRCGAERSGPERMHACVPHAPPCTHTLHATYGVSPMPLAPDPATLDLRLPKCQVTGNHCCAHGAARTHSQRRNASAFRLEAKACCACMQIVSSSYAAAAYLKSIGFDKKVLLLGACTGTGMPWSRCTAPHACARSGRAAARRPSTHVMRWDAMGWDVVR